MLRDMRVTLLQQALLGSLTLHLALLWMAPGPAAVTLKPKVSLELQNRPAPRTPPPPPEPVEPHPLPEAPPDPPPPTPKPKPEISTFEIEEPPPEPEPDPVPTEEQLAAEAEAARGQAIADLMDQTREVVEGERKQHQILKYRFLVRERIKAVVDQHHPGHTIVQGSPDYRLLLRFEVDAQGNMTKLRLSKAPGVTRNPTPGLENSIARLTPLPIPPSHMKLPYEFQFRIYYQ